MAERYRNRFTGRFMSKAAVDAIQRSVHSGVNARGGAFGLSVPLTLDAAGFHQGILMAKNALNGFSHGVSASLMKVRGSVMALASAINPLTLALGAGGLAGSIGALVSMNNQLSRSMTRSLAIMSEVSDKMRGDMRQAAIDVSKTTMFSASQAADAYFYLASAGLSAEQSLKSMPVVANFAQAGYFDLATATNMLADSQSALGMRTGDAMQDMINMTRISDVLTKANIIANAEVEDFAAALVNNAAGALRLVNKEVEEGVAVLAAYADQGIKGEEAGTALGIVMRDLQTKSLKFKDAFKTAGVEVYDTSGKMNNMADIIEDLENRLDGLSDAQKKGELLKMGFADRSVAFLQTLLGTSDRIREYEEQLRGASGATSELADKIQTPLDKAMQKFKGSLQEVSGQTEPLNEVMTFYLNGWAENIETINIKMRAGVAIAKDWWAAQSGDTSMKHIKAENIRQTQTDAIAPTSPWAEFARTAHTQEEINAFAMRRMLAGDFSQSDAFNGIMQANSDAMSAADAAAGQGVDSQIGNFMGMAADKFRKGSNFYYNWMSRPQDYMDQQNNPAEYARRQELMGQGMSSQYAKDAAKREAEAKVKAEQSEWLKFGKDSLMNNSLIGNLMKGAGLDNFGAIKDKAKLMADQVAWAPNMAVGAARRFMEEQGLKAPKEGGMGQMMFTSAQDPLSREGFAQRVRSGGQEAGLAKESLQVAKQSAKSLHNIEKKMTGESIILVPANMA